VKYLFVPNSFHIACDYQYFFQFFFAIDYTKFVPVAGKSSLF